MNYATMTFLFNFFELGCFLWSLVTQVKYEEKTKELQNQKVELEAQLKNIGENKAEGLKTLELIKKSFLTANYAGKRFLEINETEKHIVLNKVLWNLKIKDNKIANFSLKDGYREIQKAPNLGTFQEMWTKESVVRTFYYSIDKLIKSLKVACLA